MSRNDCICNRNIKIIASYVESKLGSYEQLLEGLSYPSDRYGSPDDFFLNENEWTTYRNFQTIIRKAKDMVGEAYFYYYCGVSPANLHSWGLLNFFTRVFKSPSDGIKQVPFFNKNLNDTKEIDVITPPAYDKALGKIRAILKVEHHPDIDVNEDYPVDPYRRGLISSIPTIWGLSPAKIKQPLTPYDPVILFNQEPEFKDYHLSVQMEKGFITAIDPESNKRTVIGKIVILEPDHINGQEIYLGRYKEEVDPDSRDTTDNGQAILVTKTIQANGRIICKAGEIFKAPYFILDVTFDKLSLFDRISEIFKLRKDIEYSHDGLIETVNRLREYSEEKSRAYKQLETANRKLEEANRRLEEYNKNLEIKVEERTVELAALNRNLQETVDAKVEEIKRYNELRRYLSPHVADRLLGSGGSLGSEPQRKVMTVLFSDIRNFSYFTDNLEPEETVHLLHRYLSEMTALIHKYGGTLNKIMGDGLMVFFGDPIPMEDHAEHAVRLAIEMQKKVRELKTEWSHYGHELGVGIGINTGYMTVGSIGSEMHKDYTVIGNQVNVASRLESRAGAGQILISQRTYSKVKDLFSVEIIGTIEVKGIHHPVAIYNVSVE